MDFIENLKRESKVKLAIGAGIILTIAVLALHDPYDEEYMQEVEKELVIAKAICENSLDYVMRHSKKLKLGHNKLDNIKVNGKLMKLEHVKYPEVLFFHTGFKHPNAGNELYCSFSDPRSSSQDFFYNYEYKTWVKNMRSRR